MDDCIVAARALTVVEANNKVVNMVTRSKGMLEWSHSHNSKFELDKTGLVIFTNRRVSDPARPRKTIPIPRPSVFINGQEIKPSPTIKFLGLILDQELKFKPMHTTQQPRANTGSHEPDIYRRRQRASGVTYHGNFTQQQLFRQCYMLLVFGSHQ
jgi:hypothetical protein